MEAYFLYVVSAVDGVRQTVMYITTPSLAAVLHDGLHVQDVALQL
jgi:hypothetical protein